MQVLAVDPGPTRSAYIAYDAHGHTIWPEGYGHIDNERFRVLVQGVVPPDGAGPILAPVMGPLVIEQVEHYGTGMPAGRDVFETCFWSGRFVEAWAGPYYRVPRRTVKLALCGSARAKDSHVRQAVIDRWGGQEQAIGGIKCPQCKGKGWRGRGRSPCPAPSCTEGWLAPPGPLRGIAGDVWQALALALAFCQTYKEGSHAPEAAVLG